MQNDFHRSFLMLRPLKAKDSASTGFCRMERKGNRGKLVISVQGLQQGGALQALLISQDTRDTKVTPCGELRTNNRGQGTITYSIDNLSDSAASAFRAVGVASVSGEQVELSMVGFFGRGRPFDTERIETLAAKALGYEQKVEAVEQEAQSQPEPIETVDPVVAELTADAEAAGAAPVQADESEAAREVETPEHDEHVDFSAFLLNEPAKKVEEEEVLLPPNIWSREPVEPGMSPALGLPEELEGVVWPEGALPLRELFERFEIVSMVTEEENELFVSIPMNGGMAGVDHYLLGVRVEDNYVRAIGYGIPGEAHKLPGGLEGYAWMSTRVGGYWIKWEEAS